LLQAEDKLRRERQELRNELRKRKKLNDELEAELFYTLKVRYARSLFKHFLLEVYDIFFPSTARRWILEDLKSD
jgi:hypothetical protein